MTEPLARVDGLHRSFGDLVAVDDVSFTIQPGETYGLLGPNGAGKTTTISMLCGLLDPDSGSVTVAGQPIDAHATGAKGAIGYVPQELAFYPDLTARENLRYFGQLQRMEKAHLAARIERVLEAVDLASRGDDAAKEFSGGMQRRLNIAIGLLHEPRLLVLDEPTAGVDPQSRSAIIDRVHELGDGGTSILYTTHYMEEAERLCDRIGIIDAGRIVAEGTRAELVRLVDERSKVTIRGAGNLAAAAERARTDVPGVSSAVVEGGGITLSVADAGATLAPLLAAVTSAGVEVAGVELDEPDLESVFLHLTGRALRD